MCKRFAFSTSRLVAATIAVLISAAATLAIPLQFTHQGLLTDAEQVPLNSEHNLVFNLYDGPLPESAILWTEAHASVSIINGYYSVSLGATSPLTQEILRSQELWLGVAVDSDPEMSPRIRVLATPYALLAITADSVSEDNLKDLIQIWKTTPDADGDGFDKSELGGDDCDDWNPYTNPTAVEICDGRDNNCNGQIDEGIAVAWYLDNDHDGFGRNANPIISCDSAAGYTQIGGDCNDNNPDINPSAYDICDLLDNNCNGIVDENGSLGYWYPDEDGDGFGRDADGLYGCPPDSTWTEQGGDCNDTDPSIHPNAPEICDGIDQNCNGIPDDGTSGCTEYWPDDDGDEWGDDYAEPVCLCAPTPPYTALRPADCDDHNPNINPYADEYCNNRIDDDCDGETDEPGGIGCTYYYRDDDLDGWGNQYEPMCACDVMPPYDITQGGDCNDSNPDAHPGATEYCNGIDDDCDGLTDEEGSVGCTEYWRDVDGDEWGDDNTPSRCLCAPSGSYTVTRGGDCDDNNPLLNPLASEVCNSIDDDCDGETDEEATGCSDYWRDLDYDGWGDNLTPPLCLCSPQPPFTAAHDGDCDDENPLRHPNAAEICNGIDDDCDGETDEGEALGCSQFWLDLDDDGWGDGNTPPVCRCGPTPDYYRATQPGDCNDGDPWMHPGLGEICDGKDNDCDGQTDEPGAESCVNVWHDLDDDGWGDTFLGCICNYIGVLQALQDGDCDDNDPNANPDTPENCSDGVDNDCDGFIDGADSDCQ